MAKSRQQAEFGDFQTPWPLAEAVCDLLQRRGIRPAAVVEPTCGQGNLLLTALTRFPGATTALGLDVNARHLADLQAALGEPAAARAVRLIHGDFFTTDWAALLAELPEPLLLIGNPPWVTSAELGSLASGNVPPKSNFQGHAGLDAITGKSNFDLAEWMLIRLLTALHGRRGTLAMLCKTAVARKLLMHAWKQDLPLRTAALYGIDAARHFDASVEACLLVCDFQPGARARRASVFADLGAEQPRGEWGWRSGRVVADVEAFDRWSRLAADEPDRTYVWRSGVKHDAARIMELRDVEGRWYNKRGEPVDLEPTYIYPLLKSSDIAGGRTACPAQGMIVTQATVGAATDAIRVHAPKTWAYLLAHASLLDGRRSSVYRRRPRFAMFGVGDYTFAPYKVAISGLYKKLQFEVVGSHAGKPIVFDDTVAFLACGSPGEAQRLARLLNSPPAREFYASLIFWDAKRPVTIDVLKRLDLRELARQCGCPGPDEGSSASAVC